MWLGCLTGGVLGFRQLGGFDFCFGCLRLVGCFVVVLVVLSDFGGCLLGGCFVWVV